jgi:hypothetical protein
LDFSYIKKIKITSTICKQEKCDLRFHLVQDLTINNSRKHKETPKEKCGDFSQNLLQGCKELQTKLSYTCITHLLPLLGHFSSEIQPKMKNKRIVVKYEGFSLQAQETKKSPYKA